MAANTNNLPENAPERVVGFTTGWLSYPPVVIPGFHEDLANYQPSARPHNHDPGAPSSSRSQAPTNREGELRTSGWELVEEIVIPGALLRSATAWNLRAGANLRVAGPESTDLSVNRGAPSQSTESTTPHDGSNVSQGDAWRLARTDRSRNRYHGSSSGRSASYYIPVDSDDNQASQSQQPGTTYAIDQRLLRDDSDSEDCVGKVPRVPTGLDPVANCFHEGLLANKESSESSRGGDDSTYCTSQEAHLMPTEHSSIADYQDDPQLVGGTNDSLSEASVNAASNLPPVGEDATAIFPPREVAQLNDTAVAGVKKIKIFKVLAKMVGKIKRWKKRS